MHVWCTCCVSASLHLLFRIKFQSTQPTSSLGVTRQSRAPSISGQVNLYWGDDTRSEILLRANGREVY